jgi:hypothetical protein
MTLRTTVRLPEELLIRAKRKAAAEGRTLTSLIEEGLRRVVAEERRASPAKRKLPRVSTARGGVMPGIDLDDFSSIQEMDDLAYVERMRRGFE